MNLISYRNHVPAEWLIQGSFLDRNPNMSYLLTSSGQDARSVLIDASVDPERITHDLAQQKSTLEYILITHHHDDHVFALPELIKKFPGVSVGIHKSSLQDLSARGFANLFPLENNMVISMGDEALSVIYTLGHTFDSVCFWNQKGNLFFAGDTIFGGGIGCCDYSAGGNRNIFYQTIVNLLDRLAPDTRIYPGHFSEHYQTVPPYDIAMEKVKNLYIANALQGKRGAFDRDLKEFSIEFETDNYAMMDESEIDRIYALEKEAWVPELQASKETILTRLRNGHNLLAVKKHNELLGMIGWCYSEFSIQKGLANFPRKFSDFSASKNCTNRDVQSAFIYNVGVKATFRQGGTGSLLLQRAFEKIRADGIHHVFVDSRLPSYNGSQTDSRENVKQIPEFKEVIDRYFLSNQFPNEREFALDPSIRFYMKNGFKPWLILKDFIQDHPSNNMRVICCLNLEQDNFRSF